LTRTFLLAVSALALLASPSFVAAQSLADMAGQMVVVGFQGDGPNDRSVAALREDVADGTIGGVMYLRTNVASLDAVSAMNAAFLEARPDLPPFITLDQEGGAVERLTRSVGFAEIPDAATIAARNTPAQAEAIYADLATRIAALGFNVNFGPVADLAINPSNPVIARYGRAFSADPETVAAYDRAFIEGHQAANVLTSLKHFPGHGSSTEDSHEGFVDITETWQQSELQPYADLIASGYDEFVMIGHLYHADYSGGVAGLPSSFTPQWIDGVLRSELDFQGVVISDDLEMGAIREHFTLEVTIVKAVEAGMDVLLFSNTADYDADLGERVRDILIARAEADPAFADRIEASYQRIVQLKQRLLR
jgi:beta-N-acetylhexosaminidase